VLVTIWYTQRKRLWFKEKERCWATCHGIKGQWRYWRKMTTNDASFWTKCFVEVFHTKEWRTRVYRLCLYLSICVCVPCALVQMLHWAVDKAARCQQCGVIKSYVSHASVVCVHWVGDKAAKYQFGWFISGTCLIHTWAMTHPHACHDAFIEQVIKQPNAEGVTWSHAYACHDSLIELMIKQLDVEEFELWHTYQWVMAHISIIHGTRVDEFCSTYKWVM